MLESFVSVLPCDWFTLSGWPGFSSCSVITKEVQIGETTDVQVLIT